MIAPDDAKRAEFKVYGAIDAERGGLDYVKATSRTETSEEAKAIAAQFPRNLGLRVHRFIGRNGSNDTGEVVFHGDLYSNKRRRGVNEGGVKRYRSFLKHAEFLGHEVRYDPGHFQNFPDVIPSESDFEILLGDYQKRNWSGLIDRILAVRS